MLVDDRDTALREFGLVEITHRHVVLLDEKLQRHLAHRTLVAPINRIQTAAAHTAEPARRLHDEHLRPRISRAQRCCNAASRRAINADIEALGVLCKHDFGEHATY